MIRFLLVLIIACQVSSILGITCRDSEHCQEHLGSKSRCRNNVCGCADHYFFSQRDENSNGSCTQCPGIGETCAATQCCNARYLVCQNNVCVCFSSEYCWDIDDAQRIRFERIAQCILGAALILTGTILLVLFWRTCSRRRDIQEALSRDRFPSLNSIQRFVLMQLQDRPPPYSQDCLHSKYASDISEPPPSYIEAIGLSNQPGEDNLVFIQEEEVVRELSANSLLSAMKTEPTPESSLESHQTVTLNKILVASTSQNPESNRLAKSVERSNQMSCMSTSLLAENELSETPQVAPVDTSISASTSQSPESNWLARSSQISCISTGLSVENEYSERQHVAPGDISMSASTSHCPESNRLASLYERRDEMSHMSTGFLSMDESLEPCHSVPLDSALTSTSRNPDTIWLTTKSAEMSHMSTGFVSMDESLEPCHSVPLDSALTSTSRNPETIWLTTRSAEMSHMSNGPLVNNNLSETCHGVSVDASAFASLSGDPESFQLTRSNSGSGELTQFQEIEAPSNRLAHTQNDSNLMIPPTFHQSSANQSIVATNIEIHI